jgi:MraZ protein
VVKRGEMLIGEYKSKIGAKKRVAIPKLFRNELGSNLILTRGYEGSLIIVNKSQWENIAKDVINGSFTDKSVRDSTRFLVGGAVELDPDDQGRIVIPSSLFEYAELERECIFIGLVNWVEIWDTKRWKERLTYINENADTIADELKKMTNE